MSSTTFSDFEQALAAREDPRWVLRLYVAGGTPRSLRATKQLRAICAEYLEGRHDLTVVDLHDMPERAREDDVLAVPTLVKSSPPPRRLVVGDLADERRVLSALGLHRSDS